MLLFCRGDWWTWRGSNPVPPLIPRNLLILRNGRNAKNGQNASLRYTAGTRTAARGHWEFENPRVIIKPPSAEYRYEGRSLQGPAMQHFITRFRLTLCDVGCFLEMADDRK